MMIPEKCQGTNCGTTTCQHSRECLEESASEQGWPLPAAQQHAEPATPSEDGEEVVTDIADLFADSKCAICGDTGHFIVDDTGPEYVTSPCPECNAPAAKDAQTEGPCQKCIAPYDCSLDGCAFDPHHAVAQPARQMGGDEHVAYKQHPAIIGYARKKELAPLLDRTQPDGSYIYIGLDHPACWEEEPPYDHLEPLYIGAALAPAAVVMPERDDYHQIAFEIGGTEDGAYHFEADELDAFVARLNRRAIPAGLLERAADMLVNSTHYNPSAVNVVANELRDLLGKEVK